VLVKGLGSIRLVTASLVTLLVGLALTAGFAAVVIGHLNLISVTFAVLFIGLSIDFAIHVCIPYRELLVLGRSKTEALRQTTGDVGGALAICALTTSIGFYAFVPTDYLGVAELGLIAGSGMLISLFSNLTLLPALLMLMPPPPVRRRLAAGPSRLSGFLALPVRHARRVFVGVALLALAAAPLVSRWSFDPNPLRVRDPSTESVQTYDDLLAEGKAFPWNLHVMTSDRASADALAERIGALDTVDHTLTLSDFVARDQEEKLALLSDTALLLGPALAPSARSAPPSVGEQIAAVTGLETALTTYDLRAVEPALASAEARLRAALAAFRAARLGADDVASALAELEESLLGSFDERLDLLRTALATEGFGLDDLPSELVDMVVAPDGRVRVEAFPREDLNDTAALERYVAEIRTVAPDAFGVSVVIVESAQVVVGALREALLVASILVVALLLSVWRSPLDAALVAVPLGLAALFTAAAAALVGVPLNFANVIVVPLLLGIGVDSGIHMVHRFRAGALPSGNLLRTPTARAVFYSALTTIASFGTLALSTHLGLASLGRLLTLGLALILVCNLVVLPAAVAFVQARKRPVRA
jgi:hopanoid biosynthesis associated RND transporter like protein HpnN